MKKSFSILNWFSFLMPTSAVIRLTGQQLFLPVYHTLQDRNALPHIHHLYPPKSTHQFEKDLDFILKHFHPITLNDVFEIANGEQKLKKNSFHLSFDDGLREVYELAFPILKKKGIPATLFLNSAFVDNQNLFYRYKASLLIEKLKTENFSKSTYDRINFLIKKESENSDQLIQNILKITFAKRNMLNQIAPILDIDFDHFLKTQQPYLSSSQIHFLQKNEFTIGAHSINHPKFSEISFEEKIQQTKQSIDFVQTHFPEKIKAFGFPFHDKKVGNEFFEKIKSEAITDLTFGSDIFSKRKIANHLQRFPMEGNSLNAKALFNFKSLFYFTKKIFNF